MHVFTYGSLMFPDIWQRVVRGAYRSSPATLPGHARFALADETYPGVVVRPDGEVEGVLYLDVSDADIAALDVFEGQEYRRVEVVVRLPSGESMPAGTYLFLAAHRLSDQPWEPAAFRMARFIDTYCHPRPGSEDGATA